jgi:ankyrin repeat protein
MSSAALFEAIASGDAARVRSLVAEDATLAGCRNDEGISARMLALYRGDVDMLEPLVDAGPELDVFEAAGLGAEERLEELLAHDASLVSARAGDGFTPLHLAAFFVHPGAARILLDAGADVNAVADNPMRVQPLHRAAAGDSVEICRLLLERGADPNERQAAGGRPLDAARQNGNDELTDLLIAHGATP